MASDLTFTGERFLPDCSGEIAYEHWHGYAFARRFAVGRRGLDAVCGEGYGTALLETIEHLHAAGTRSLPARPEAVARRASGTLVSGRRT